MVSRIAPQASASNVMIEIAAMRHAATAGLPVPNVLCHNDGAVTGFALALTSYVVGSSRIPLESDSGRL